MSIRIGIEGGERIKSLLRLGDVGLNDCTAWPLGHDWTSARCLVSVGRMKAATNPSSEELVYCRWTGCRHPSWRSLWLPLVVRGGGPRNGLRGGPHGGCPRRLPVVVPHGNRPPVATHLWFPMAAPMADLVAFPWRLWRSLWMFVAVHVNSCHHITHVAATADSRDIIAMAIHRDARYRTIQGSIRG